MPDISQAVPKDKTTNKIFQMKKLALLFTLCVIGCTPKLSFERQAILDLCNDHVEDSCIINLPGDTLTTHFVKAAFGNNGLYYISDLPLSDPRMRIYLNDGLRTRYFSDFTYIGLYENVYVYALSYQSFPRLSRYDYDHIKDCDLYYYNGIDTMFTWNMTFYPDTDEPEKEESFSYWFKKAIPFILQ